VIDGIPVRRIPYSGSSRYPFAPAVMRHIGEADVVHVHGIDFFFDFLALTKMFHRKPLVASTHGGFFHTEFAGNFKKLFFRQVTRRTARAYSAICASSENDGALFATIAPDKVVVIENGVAIEKWLELTNNKLKKSIIAIGRFSENKRLGALITTIAALNRLDAGWTLTIAGQESDLSSDELQAKANASGVKVEVVANPSDQVIADLIGRSSYIASASRFEGFGISVIEGMGAGLVPLLSPIPPFEKLIHNAGAGLIVDFEDSELAAIAIIATHRALAQNHDELRRACIRFTSRFAWSAVAAKFAGIYRRAAAERGSQTSIFVSG